MSDALITDSELASLLSDIRQVVDPIRVYADDTAVDPSLYSLHIVSLEEIIFSLQQLVLYIPTSLFNDINADLRRLLNKIRSVDQELENPVYAEQQWVRMPSGQWNLSIPDDLLCQLQEEGFSNLDCAILLQCSQRTINRRKQQLGLSRKQTISDEDLDAISRERMRQAVRRIDPLAVNSRWLKYLKRREYYVPFVNSLWHIDGHHKLIRWKIVIHGGIDGKSRLVTYLRAAGNNRAETVGAAFIGAVETRGWPSRVRGDHGGENAKVMELMNRVRVNKYRAWFETLEATGLLDVECDVHLWALHFVYMRQLNGALDHFIRMWNNHKMRTKGLGNKTPEQIFTLGAWSAARRGVDVGMMDREEVDEMRKAGYHSVPMDLYGVEADGSERIERPQVTIDKISERVPAILNEPATHERLKRLLPAKAFPPPADFGLSTYLAVLDALDQMDMEEPISCNAR
ncbi:hypothetical protein OC861_000242 [Tilletia horrida]|nr:hypothetical protein OC861_000242 [Tilletia horrida]